MNEPWWFAAVSAAIAALFGLVLRQWDQSNKMQDKLLQYLEKDGERRERAVETQANVASALQALLADEKAENVLLQQVAATMDRVMDKADRICRAG